MGGRRRVLALDASVVPGDALLSLVESERPLGALDVVGLNDLVVATEFALWIRESVNEVLESVGSHRHLGVPVERTTPREDGVQLEPLLAGLVAGFDLVPVQLALLASNIGGPLAVYLSLDQLGVDFSVIVDILDCLGGATLCL